MKKTLFVILFMTFSSAHALPWYFFSGIGGQGSLQRGLTNNVGGIGFGSTVFQSGKYAVDLEFAYTRAGRISGNEGSSVSFLQKPQPQAPILPAPPPKPTPPAPPPVVVTPDPIHVAPPPIVIVPDPVPVAPDPVLVAPPPVVVVPDPLPPPVAPPCDDEICGPPGYNLASIKSLKSNTRVSNMKPKLRSDYYSVSINPRVNFYNKVWFAVRIGVEQHVLDGNVVTYIKGGGLPDITTEESISDDKINFFGGAGAIVGIRKQLDGYVTADYHDANNSVDDKDFDSDDLIIMTGLRFGF